MSKVSEALAELEPEARARVLSWAADRYEISGVTKTQLRGQPANEGVEEANAGTSDYESMADLYAAAGPSTNPERVLVAGYWLQTKQGASNFSSHEINSQLRDLGHKVDSINKVFEALKNQKPQLAIQVSSGGSNPKARKRHKLTRAGIELVESMLNGDDS